VHFKDGEEQCKSVASSIEIWCLLFSGSIYDGQLFRCILLEQTEEEKQVLSPLKENRVTG